MPRLVPPVLLPGALATSAQPAIDGEDGVVLGRFEPADAPVVVAAFADPDVQRWHFRRMDDVGEAEDWIAATHDDWMSEKAATWGIRSDGGAVLGRITLYPRLAAGTGEVSYWLLPAARGRGVATGAVRALTRWAHGALGLQRLELEHSVDNPRSCRVAAKAGFRLEGTMRRALLHADGWHDMHLHAHLAVDLAPGASDAAGWTS